MCRWVSFHTKLRSEIEFRHHLPVVLWIHNLLIRTCIWRTAGRCCRNFDWHYFFLLVGRGKVTCSSGWQVHPRHDALVDSKVRQEFHYFSSCLCIFRSCNPSYAFFPFETDMVENMQMFAYLWPYLFRIVHTFMDSLRMCTWVSFHATLQSEIEFRHHLPIVLWIHNLLIRTCIWRTAGRCCRNSISGRR